MLSRDALKTANDSVIETVIVSEWDNTEFFIRRLGGTERSQFEESLLEEKIIRDSKGRKKTIRKVELSKAKAKLVVLCCVISPVDETLYFQSDDWKWLSDKSASALEKLYTVAQRLAGMSSEDMEEISGN